MTTHPFVMFFPVVSLLALAGCGGSGDGGNDGRGGNGVSGSAGSADASTEASSNASGSAGSGTGGDAPAGCENDPTSLPVVPCAFGSGMETRAAYGNGTDPDVLRVTSVDDSGPGSLREALEATGPRVVIFETSGTIMLSSDIVVTSPYLTVAGETAPSPGITLAQYGIQINAHDVLLQHFRVRKGNVADDITCGNNLEVWGPDAYNVVLANMSSSWGQDEGIVVYNSSVPSNTVIWRTIMAEGLYYTPGSEACAGGGASGGHGLLVYTETKGVTVVQSLFTKNDQRNPNMQGGTATVLLNNVVYDWHSAEGFLFVNFNSGGGNGNPWVASAVGNRFIGGPYTAAGGDPAYMFLYSDHGGIPRGNQIYRADNTSTNDAGNIVPEFNALTYDPNVGAPPTEAAVPPGYAPLASDATEDRVRSTAGARPVDRDSVDARLITEMTDRTDGTMPVIYSSDVGGWPALENNPRPLDVPPDPHALTPSGYTNLEVWLHGYSAMVEGK
jgi:hypothetical protein